MQRTLLETAVSVKKQFSIIYVISAYTKPLNTIRYES
jgi:hypothetical protein